MSLIRLASAVVTLTVAVLITRGDLTLARMPSALAIRDHAQTWRTHLQVFWDSAGQDVIAPLIPAEVQSGAPEVARPDSDTVVGADTRQSDRQEASDSESIAIPFLRVEGSSPPQSGNALNATAFREGRMSGRASSDLAADLSELPQISIPREVPAIDEPSAPNLRPAEPSTTDQIFTRMNGVRTFLLMGSDKREQDSTWRTDVVIIVVLDQQRDRVDLISVPRDLYIENPPRQEPNKINTFDYWGEQEYPGGGQELMKEIVQSHFGIPINHFVRVQFEGFSKIVDAVGGVEVFVPCPLYDVRPEENLYLSLQPGQHTLNGEKALAYVRSRQQGGDLARVQRQQQVLVALKRKFTVRNMLPQIPSLYAAVRNSVETDVGLFDAVALARLAYNLEFDKINSLSLSPRVHFEDGWARGMQVWLPSWEKIREDVQKLLADSTGPDLDTVGASAAEIEQQMLTAAKCQ